MKENDKIVLLNIFKFFIFLSFSFPVHTDLYVHEEPTADIQAAQ